MKTGTVIGRIVASKRLPELPAGALLEVQLDYPKDVVVCYDPMGCGIGERVMITIGAPAAWWFAPAQQRVVSYDPITNTAAVQPAIGGTDAGSGLPVTLPIYPGITVCWPRGAGVTIRGELLPGDTVLLLTSDRAIV